MSTPTIDKFLGEVARILLDKNGPKLQDYLILEPPLPPLYNIIVNELRQTFPANNQDALEAKCEALLPKDEEGAEGGSWTAFISFLIQYFAFLRDVNVDHLVETHDMLKALLNQCILALSDASMGSVVLPTVISLSRTLARLAIGLDKRPELIAHLTRRESVAGNEEAGERVTLVESSANVIREAFKKCLSERSGNAQGIDSNGKPEGKRIGIYLTANICLKLFFHCKKIRNAEQIFGNIYQQSPPLALFPAAQRVTFLYYLGRYLFANNHFYRAQLALQAAYDQCHARCLKQRRLILVYLITSNIILGRFPSTRLLQRPEAEALGNRFLPICRAIAKGDLATFRSLLSLDNDNADWFLRRRILLQLRNRCTQGDAQRDSGNRAPTLDLDDLLALSIFLEKGILNSTVSMTNGNSQANGHLHTNSIFMTPKAGSCATSREEETGGYIDPDLRDAVEPTGPDLPTMATTESVVSSLIDQGLLHGYISHRLLRFAIVGAKVRGALQAGFPNVWETIKSKANDEVPGWVKEEKDGTMAGGLGTKFGPGIVVNLSGARPAGAAPG
ncbi:PCI/PINT associated module [Lasallia pustulata]|uniref:PCI/PINT associated module n=1 Tax=Lasallia pustulata TaxID=136370 RepID=A0A1W5CW71_9LECA|nr:PCI/PINT associated module [Lasallia pustulata]